MTQTKKLSANMENYLEAVLMLEEEKRVARVKDISQLLHVSQPSAHSAISTLLAQGYIQHESYGHVELTSSGRKIAEGVYRRHKILTKFLRGVLKVDPKLVEKDACGMEHTMSSETLEKLTRFIEFMEVRPDGNITNCMVRFDEFYKNGKVKKCELCKE